MFLLLDNLLKRNQKMSNFISYQLQETTIGHFDDLYNFFVFVCKIKHISFQQTPLSSSLLFTAVILVQVGTLPYWQRELRGCKFLCVLRSFYVRADVSLVLQLNTRENEFFNA